MMPQTEHFPYAEGEGFQALELPYDGGELSMVILLPDEGQFGDFEESLNIGQLYWVVDNLASRNAELTMPKFTYESEFSLAQTLVAMGMPDAFSTSADFSGIDGTPGRLMITDVIHKAFVLVDEAGTEAAAATAVIFAETSAPNGQEPIVFTVDRPFVFFIRDIETDTILFIGRVVDPQ
jgi:serpin B